jgi:hypothetical protein
MFSFLDAMICTLGALLVLLHAFARHGQIQAVRKAEAKAAQEARDDPRVERELVEWRIAQLKRVRATTEAQLANERLKLSHVEDHERRLQAKFNELKIALAELGRLKDADQTGRLRDQAALEAARIRLVEARAAALDAQRQGRQAASYSVVPYEGPNRTHRRPIYIECRQDAMILQPEGIELTPADFAGFLGPGNPLAQALRGAREYYARQSSAGLGDSEPYPLLLVRPEGVKTYYAARSALDSWGSEFGYELIGSDWNLKFAQPDQRLAELLRQIVADARMRMRDLMLATSQLSAYRPRATLRASTSGGFVVECGPRAGAPRASVGSASVGGWDSLDSDWARGDAAPSGDETAAVGRQGGQGEVDALRSGGSGMRGGEPKLTGSPGQSQHGGGDSRDGGATNQQESPEGHLAGQPGASALGQPGGNVDAEQRGDDFGPSDGKSESQAGVETASPSATQNGGANAGSSAGVAGDPSALGGTSAESSATAGMPQATISHGHKPRQTTSIAKVRGRDWGLPDAGAGMAPATRPILVECHNDRLVIVPDEPAAEAKVTRLGDEARENIDEFVSDVWQHMKGWGIAGRGLYWRPTLVMSVEPGAADRYAEIKALLADSGLDVRERRPRAAGAPSTSSPTRR